MEDSHGMYVNNMPRMCQLSWMARNISVSAGERLDGLRVCGVGRDPELDRLNHLLASAFSTTSWSYIWCRVWRHDSVIPGDSLWIIVQIFILWHTSTSNSMFTNKANLTDLISATSLVILLKLDSNRGFLQPVRPWNSIWCPRKEIWHHFRTMG